LSVSFRINVNVSKLKKGEADTVKRCILGSWYAFNYEDIAIAENGKTVYAQADGGLSMMDDTEFARNFAEDVWTELKRFVPVSVSAACLDNIPTEEYDFDKEMYREWQLDQRS
jgi:hypothetical protein